MKRQGDMQTRRPQSMAELSDDFARQIAHPDARFERFWNFEPPPIYLEPDGYFRSDKKTKAIIGGNKSYKTTVGIWECVMIFTGMVPPVLDGIYAHQETLLSLTSGDTRRPRHVRIIIQDFSKAWPETIKPFLLGDPEQGAVGMLPEAWSEFDEEEHMFYGPDGSFMSIMSVDPTQKIDPRKLRGPLIDHTYIDEGTLQVAYSESLTRSAGLKDGPRDVCLGFCPQDGYEDWTYETLYGACYDLVTDERKPQEKCHPDIFSQRVCMKDNPEISPEDIAAFESSMPQYQVAFRVHGRYSNMATNPYFDMKILLAWWNQKVYSDGIPHILEAVDIDLEAGVFKAKLVEVGLDEFDERYDPVWWMWEGAQDGEKYVVTADTAMGNPESDYQCGDVLAGKDPANWRQVGQLRIRELKPGDFALQCAMMGFVFGKCLLAYETNNESGGIFGDRIRQYPNLYTRITVDKLTEKPTEKMGWYSDRYSKPLMLENLYKSLREQYAEGRCPFRSRFTLAEMQGYEERVIRDKTSTYMRTEWGARPGGHDDTVISVAIGNRVIQHEPEKLSTCNLNTGVVDGENEKGLTEFEKEAADGAPRSGKAFRSLRPKPNITTLRRRHGVTRSTRHGR